MGVHSFLVPCRFLTMLGHFLAALLVFFSYRDNIVVSLRFDYTDAEYNGANSSMLAAIVLTFICLALQAVGFFGGFTMFDVSLALLHCCCHVSASILLSFIVIQKWHYVTTWYVFGFFSVAPALLELSAILSVVLLKKRRW